MSLCLIKNWHIPHICNTIFVWICKNGRLVALCSSCLRVWTSFSCSPCYGTSVNMIWVLIAMNVRLNVSILIPALALRSSDVCSPSQCKLWLSHSLHSGPNLHSTSLKCNLRLLLNAETWLIDQKTAHLFSGGKDAARNICVYLWCEVFIHFPIKNMETALQAKFMLYKCRPL